LSSAGLIARSLFCAWDTGLLLLIVLPVHSCVGLVASIRGVWVLSVLLVVLSVRLGIVGCACGCGTHRRCGLRILSVTSVVAILSITSISGVSTTISSASIPPVVAVIAIAVIAATISMTVVIPTINISARGPFFELLVLSADVG